MKSNVLAHFPSCHNEQVEALIARYAVELHIPARQMFVRPGDIVDSIYYIREGRTRHYMINSDGVEKIAYILNRGWFLREGAFAKTPYPAERYSSTEEETTLYVIDYDTYQKLMEYPAFMCELVWSSSAKNGLLRREMESIIFDSAKDRLCHLLLASTSSELIDGSWYPLTISYTHQEIAAIIGVNRVTVSRFIAEMAKVGEIRVINKEIQISSNFHTRYHAQ